jgi:hypothetical protein
MTASEMLPAEAITHIRRHLIRPVLHLLLTAGVRPWVIVQALEGELRDLERTVDKHRKDWRDHD